MLFLEITPGSSMLAPEIWYFTCNICMIHISGKGRCATCLLRVWLSKPPLKKKQLLIVFNNCKTYEGSQIRSIRKFHQLQNKSSPKSQTPADWVMRKLFPGEIDGGLDRRKTKDFTVTWPWCGSFQAWKFGMDDGDGLLGDTSPKIDRL